MTISTTTVIDLRLFKDELLNHLRKNLYSLDPKSRISEDTVTFSGDGSTTKFLLSTSLSHISSVSISAATKDYGDDWLPIFDSDSAFLGYIEFTTAPADGTDNISITRGVSEGPNFIYADFPRVDLAASSYPRVGLNVMDSPVEGGLGGSENVLLNQIRISVIMLSEDARDLDKFDYTLRNAIIGDAKSFYNFRYIRPDVVRELSLSEDATGNVLARNRDYIIPDRYEISSYN